MPKNNFTEEQIREAVNNASSIAEMCRHLGIIPAGGNYGSMKRLIARFEIDVSHFTGQSWRKDKFTDSPNSKITIKKKLIRDRGHQCESCDNTTWLELPIALELEHIDGDNTNNVEENLLLLCPNCHAQTITWRRTKSVFIPQNLNMKTICPICKEKKQHGARTCNKCYQNSKANTSLLEIAPNETDNFCKCGILIAPQSKQCTKCAHIKQQRIEWPPVADLLVRLRDNRESYTSVRKSLGVSDNSVRKYLRKNNINPKTFLPLDAES